MLILERDGTLVDGRPAVAPITEVEMTTMPGNAVLLIVDVQQGFDDPRWGRRNNPQFERNTARLLDAWRRSGRPVIHVQHMSRYPESPLHPAQPGNAFKE